MAKESIIGGLVLKVFLGDNSNPKNFFLVRFVSKEYKEDNRVFKIIWFVKRVVWQSW